MTMPAALHREHFEPPWKGDSLIGLILTKHRHPHDPHPAIDQNYQWGQHCAWCLHWGIPAKDNYGFIVIKGTRKVRRMTFKERHRSIRYWTDEEVSRWRRDKSYTSTRPRPYHWMAKQATRHGVWIIPELKSPQFASKEAAQYMVLSAKAAGQPAWFMALINMKNVRGKAQAIHAAGGDFAVIFGKRGSKKQPKDWAKWSGYVSRVWGAQWGGK